MQSKIIDKKAVFATLPPPRKENFLPALCEARKVKIDVLIVLDDDPTGTQTVCDVPVLTTWETENIVKEFQEKTSLFYILTNSRSLTSKEAGKLGFEIGENIKEAAEKTGTNYWVISRADSTLRGHYPGEVSALEKGLGKWQNVHFLIPAFFEGGRYTINNIHYVQKDEELIPVALTPYAKDKVFGYQNSDLREWVAEKSGNKITSDTVETIKIEELRKASLDELIEKIARLKKGTVCVVNAAGYEDLYFFSLALFKTKIQPIFRTAASFVAAIGGIRKKPLLSGQSIRNNGKNGGLIVVGSYVPNTSLQLNNLLSHRNEISTIEIHVTKILSALNKSSLWCKYAKQIDDYLQKGHTVAVYTSRTTIRSESEKENQEIGKTISEFITQIIAHINICPSYILTKGGITSSDIATKSLGIKRAIVKGQIIEGVPVWELGEETKFPNSCQIIFPGNVGTENSLTEVVEKLMV